MYSLLLACLNVAFNVFLTFLFCSIPQFFLDSKKLCKCEIMFLSVGEMLNVWKNLYLCSWQFGFCSWLSLIVWLITRKEALCQ